MLNTDIDSALISKENKTELLSIYHRETAQFVVSSEIILRKFYSLYDGYNDSLWNCPESSKQQASIMCFNVKDQIKCDHNVINVKNLSLR